MLENQIKEDRECENDFKFRFVLFVLGALLCPIMKLFLKRSFSHLVEDIDSIKKMNWVEFVLAYLVHGIKEFKRKKQSGVCCCLFFFFYGNVLVYNLRHSEFRICYKRFCKLTIYPCKIYLQLFYHKHISFQQKFPPLCTRPSP